MNVRSSAGQLTGSRRRRADAGAVGGRRRLGSPPRSRADPERPGQKSDITADAHVDLRGEALSDIDSLRGTVSLDAPRIVAAGYAAGPVQAKARIDGRQVAIDGRAAAYGAAATVAGTVTLPERRRTLPDSRWRSICAARRATSICASCRAI